MKSYSWAFLPAISPTAWAAELSSTNIAYKHNLRRHFEVRIRTSSLNPPGSMLYLILETTSKYTQAISRKSA